ncbi:MAG: HAMP domain-containing sensor histidine kinase [Acidobacteriota bacterium]
MNRQGAWRFLFPSDEREDDSFREELANVSLVGLRIIVAITFCFPVLTLLIRLLVPSLRVPWTPYFTYPTMIVAVFAGVVSLLPQARRFARAAGWLVGAMVGSSMVVAWLKMSAMVPDSAWQNPAPLISVLLIGVVCLPLKPVHTFSLGLCLSFGYWTATRAVSAPRLTVMQQYFVIELFTWTAVCTILTAVLYAQRSAAYRARRQAQRSFEDLRRAQARLLLAENSAAQVRLAAALSHELNSPVGVLNSAVKSLLSAMKRLTEPASDPDRLQQAVQAIAHSADQSCERLNVIIKRLQRFTNLDRAEVSVVDINELLRNAVELIPPHSRQRVSLDLKPLPPLKCRPQQLNAVFSNLLRNATQSAEGEALVHVSSSSKNGDIVVRVQDHGRGIPKDRLPGLFEPGLMVKEGRVAITNWSLFNSKSILVEHGGEIHVESEEGKGTTVTVRLPLKPPVD